MHIHVSCFEDARLSCCVGSAYTAEEDRDLTSIDMLW